MLGSVCVSDAQALPAMSAAGKGGAAVREFSVCFFFPRVLFQTAVNFPVSFRVYDDVVNCERI